SSNSFLADLKTFDMLPRLTIVRMSDDAALGALAEAVSKSKFWTQTAIFVVPLSGDASHKATALAISPYTRGAKSDGAAYTTLSVLRTLEMILGLRPMTRYDASARALSFGSTANNAPYTTESH